MLNGNSFNKPKFVFFLWQIQLKKKNNKDPKFYNLVSEKY